MKQTGRGAVWLARLNGVQEVRSSNLLAPISLVEEVTVVGSQKKSGLEPQRSRWLIKKGKITKFAAIGIASDTLPAGNSNSSNWKHAS